MVQSGGKLDDQLLAVCAEPLQQHHDGGGAGGKEVRVVVEVVGKIGEDSSRSLMVEIPFLDEMVKVADSPASSNSSNK